MAKFKVQKGYRVKNKEDKLSIMKDSKYESIAGIIMILILILSIVISWAITVGIVYLICLLFSLNFSLAIAT